jgi:hypothetical protein
VLVVTAIALIAGSVKLFGRSEMLSWFAAMLGISGLVLAGTVLFLALYMVGTRITVTADAILVTHRFLSTSRVDVRVIARVVRCSVRNSVGRGRYPHAVVFAFSASGRCVLSLYAERWSQEDLDRIWRHLGVVPEGSWDDEIRDLALHTRFPHAF